jgi:hypothetical protein
MTLRLVFIVAIASIAAVACGGAATGTTGSSQAPAASQATASSAASGAIDCTLLTPADLAAAGIEGAADPTDNADEFGHYCVYAGTSGATGGIEFDVFPHDDAASATETYETVIAEGPSGQPLPGDAFDASSFAVDGDVAYATVRQGKLVFALSVPAVDNAEAGLAALATLIVQRAGAAASQ